MNYTTETPQWQSPIQPVIDNDPFPLPIPVAPPKVVRLGYAKIENLVVDDYVHRIAKDGKAPGVAGLAVYTVLARFADNKSRQCFPSLNTIANRAGVRRRHAQRILRRLEDVGLIGCERARFIYGRTASNIYTLLPLGGGRPENAMGASSERPNYPQY